MDTKFNIGFWKVDLAKVPEKERQEILNKLIEISNEFQNVLLTIIKENGGVISV